MALLSTPSGAPGADGNMDDKSDEERKALGIQDAFFSAWLVTLVLAILLSAVSAGFSGDNWSTGFKNALGVAAVGLAVSVASATVAWLFGLLFGIPRTISRGGAAAATPAPASAAAAAPAAARVPIASAVSPKPPTDTDSATSRDTGPAAGPPASAVAVAAPPPVTTSNVNTNLEDVSDWLTKTLIGVGLTQLTSLPNVAWRYATALNDATLQGQGGGSVLILCLTAAAGAGGFWLGYVTTRTSLTALFDRYANMTANYQRLTRALREAHEKAPDNLDLRALVDKIQPSSRTSSQPSASGSTETKTTP